MDFLQVNCKIAAILPQLFKKIIIYLLLRIFFTRINNIYQVARSNNSTNKSKSIPFRNERIEFVNYKLVIMDHYYVNKNAQPTGEHEVHMGSCSYLPDADNRIYLGFFLNCSDAIREAKKYFPNVDGCYYCCPNCHTR